MDKETRRRVSLGVDRDINEWLLHQHDLQVRQQKRIDDLKRRSGATTEKK